MFYSYFCEIDGMENYVVHVDLCTTPPLSCIYPLLFFITCDLYIYVYMDRFILLKKNSWMLHWLWVGESNILLYLWRKRNITSFLWNSRVTIYFVKRFFNKINFEIIISNTPCVFTWRGRRDVEREFQTIHLIPSWQKSRPFHEGGDLFILFFSQKNSLKNTFRFVGKWIWVNIMDLFSYKISVHKIIKMPINRKAVASGYIYFSP